MAVNPITDEMPRINTRRVKILMIERGLRPLDLANAWKVTGAAVSQVIHGKRPNSLLVGKLAAILGVPMKEILRDGDSPRAQSAQEGGQSPARRKRAA